VTGRQATASESSPEISGPTPFPKGKIYVVDQPVAYAEAWAQQVHLHRNRVSGCGPDTVLILEHRPVYTLGRRTDIAHWGGCEESLRRLGADLYLVNRGGSVTYHGPGQIVVYPIVKITDHARGPKQFVRLLEDVVLRLLKQWGINGMRIDRKPGIWLEEAQPAKIASIGIRVERGVTLHGLSVNVDMDLSPFQFIKPCGFADCRMTSMAAILKAPTGLHQMKQELARHFAEVFVIQWPVMSITSLTSSTLSW
jgi:lipoyl(octanoyl) transferase